MNHVTSIIVVMMIVLFNPTGLNGSLALGTSKQLTFPESRTYSWAIFG